MSRVYVPQADDAAFTKRQFVSVFWYHLAENRQHIVNDRCRLAASKRYSQKKLALFGAGPDGEVARFVFDATPLEYLYRVQLVFGANVGPNERIEVDWRVVTQDTSGANVSIGAYETHIINRETTYRQPAMDSTLPLTWPLGTRLPLRDSFTGWVSHAVDQSLATLPRVLIVQAYQTAGIGPDVWLRGVTAVGYRNGY